MHKRIFDIIKGISGMGIEIGLVTNGLLLNDVPRDIFSRITWIRISSGDNRSFSKTYKKKLERALERGKNTDFAFSHVVTKNPNYKTIIGLVKFANKNAFTHVRLVSDILKAEASKDMKAIKKRLSDAGADDDTVIYQGRKEWTKGDRNCYISLLKPVVGGDGFLYPCCGTQYALANPARDYEKTMRMGLATDIDKLYERQEHFNGSVCAKCYYKDYNDALKILLSEVHHKKFV